MEWTWAWRPHFEIWALVALVEGGYLGSLTVLGPRHATPGERRAKRRQVILFSLGVLALWVALDWPVHDLAEGLYAAHMGQHLMLAILAPPLMLLGCPAWLLRRALRPWLLLRTVRALTRPVPAFVIFNAVLAVIHWPPTVELMSRSEGAHAAMHAALLVSAFLMWVPVLSPIEELPRLSPAGRMLYLLAQSVFPMYFASFLSYSRLPLYLPYAGGTRFFGISPTLDQQIAGVVMGAGGLALAMPGIIAWVRAGPSEGLLGAADDPDLGRQSV